MERLRGIVPLFFPSGGIFLIISHSCVEYSIVENSPVVHVFGRSPENPKRRIRGDFTDFLPFLFVKHDLHGKLITDPRIRRSSLSAVNHHHNWSKITKDLVGNRVFYAETQIPKMVRDLRYEKFTHGETFQADVLFDRNFLFCTNWKRAVELSSVEWSNKTKTRFVSSIDNIKPLESDSILRYAYIDLETRHISKSNATIQEPTEPITCVSVFDSMEENLYTLQWHPRTMERRAEDKIYTFKNGKQYPWHLHFFTNEKDLLTYFISLLSNTIDFDVGLAWNANFDFPYLINRCKRVGVDANRLSPLGRAFVDRNGEPIIAGRVVFDLLAAYRKMTIVGGQKKRYRLEFVGQEELGYGKIEYPFSTTGECWENDPKQHIHYNARDVELIVEIDKQAGVTENYNDLRTEFGVEFEDVLHPSSVIDADWIRSALSRNICLPTKPPRDKNEQKHKKFAGGFVFKASAGLHGVVVQLDAKTMYLNIIDMLNASPETIAGKRADVNDRKDIGNCIIAANGLLFRRDVQSFSRECVRRYKAKRQQMKDLMVKAHDAGNKAEEKKWKRRQKSYKSVSLSYYGVQGSIHSRLYNKDMCEAITLTGQYIIRWTASIVESEDLRKQIFEKFGVETKIVVIYGDTDSIFMAGFPKTEKITQIADFIGKYVTVHCSYFKELFNSDIQPIEIRSEKVYYGFYQTYTREGADRKKTYVGNKWFEKQERGKDEYWEESNKLEVKGFEEKKSNTPAFASQIQRKILEMIVRDCLQDLESGLKKIRDFLVQSRYKFDQSVKDNRFEDVAQPTRVAVPLHTYGREKKDGTLGSVPKHVEGIIWLNTVTGTDYDAGETVFWIYVLKTPPGTPKTDVVAFVYPSELSKLQIKYDWERMFKIHVVDKVSNILAGLNISYTDLVTGKRQKKIGDYWKP